MAQDLGSRLQARRLGAAGLALLCALAGALLPRGAADAATTAPPSVQPGAWQNHELEFQFVGFTTTYSCDGLESKLRLLLTRLGARPGFTVWAYGCARGGGIPDKFARARLKFATLQPASAAAAPAPVAANGPVPDAAPAGAWKSVEFAPNRPTELERGDCELIEQFRDRLLPLFTTRDVQNQVTCLPHQVPGSFSLRLEVFAPPART
jgi:hypothetical protein